MNSLPKSSWLLSVEEYLAMEETSDVRHEYVAGEIHAMVGASRRHGRIVTNMSGHLWTALRDGSCEVATNDIKVQAAENLIYYPDIVVTCDPEDTDPYIVRRPTLVIEVLSPHTANIDRREKMVEYRKLSSLLCYLVVHQDEQRVERHWRDQAGDPWEFDMIVEGGVKIPGLDVTLSLDEIYEGIEFDDASS